MKYQTIRMLLRLFDNGKSGHDETWLSGVLDRYTRYQLRKLGLDES